MPNVEELGPIYYDDASTDIGKRMEAFYNSSISVNMAFWSEGDLDTRFWAGDQQLYSEIYGALPANKRPQFNFNRIRRVVSLIEGYQRLHRKQTVVVPVENADDKTAEQFSKAMVWLNTQENILDTISDSYRGALITGLNLMQVYLDYSNDPVSGNIKVANCAFNEFLIDPYFKKRDLSDCSAIWRRSYVTRKQLATLLPDRKDEILSMPTGSQDGKFNFTPEAISFDHRSFYTYDEFYYRDYRKQKLLVDRQTSETLEWTSNDPDKLDEFLRLYPQVSLVNQDIPTVRLAISVNGKIFYDGPNPLGPTVDMYPFVPVLGYYAPELPHYPLRIQGVVRGLRDAQYLYTRRRNIELAMLESQLTTGFIYKEGALVDPMDVYQTGEGGSVALKRNAQMTDIQQITPPQVPPSMFQLSEDLANELNQISGINEEMLGSAEDDKAGILAQLRQGAGLTTLQNLFDQLDFSQKLLGKLIMRVMQNNYTPVKIQRILNEEPTKEFYNKNFGIYDCAVEEAVLSSSQKQISFLQMMELKKIGVAVPDDVLINNLTIQNKSEIIESIKKTQQAAAEQQQQMAQTEMQLQQSQSMLAQAKTDEALSLSRERDTRSVQNIAGAKKNEMESYKNLELAHYEKIKALSELDGMSLDHLKKLVEIARALEESREEKETLQEKVRATKGTKRRAERGN